MKKLIQVIGLTTLLVSQSGFAKEQLTSRLWVDLDDKGKLSVNSNYLTYHSARITYGQNKTVSDLMLVTPAEQVISLPKWGDKAVFDEGSVFPKWSWITNGGYLETGGKNGNLSQDLPSFVGTGWNNSTVDLYGSSIYSWFGSKDTNNVDAFVMLGLNTLHGISIAAETLGSTEDAFPNNAEISVIANNIRTAQERLKDVKKWVDFFKTYGKFAEETTQFIIEFRKSATTLSDDDLVWLSDLENRIKKINVVIDQVSSALKINKADLNLKNQEQIEMETVFRQAVLDSIVDQQPPPVDHSKALSFLAKSLAVEYDKAKNGGERTLILQTKIYDLLGKATGIYESKLRAQLKSLKANKDKYTFEDYQTQYRPLKTRADLIKLGVYALEASQVVLASEVSECSSKWTGECQETFFRAIVGFGSIIVSDLFDPEVGALSELGIAKKINNWFKSQPFAELVKNGLKRTTMVTSIGNKAIPFVWDFIGAPDGFSVDIVDGQISRVGVAKHKYIVTILDGSTQKQLRTYDVNPSPLVKEQKIPISNGETWRLDYYVAQPKLFDKDRSYWENQSTAPQKAYDFAWEKDANGTVSYSVNYLCVRKTLGVSAQFGLQKEWGTGRIPASLVAPPRADIDKQDCGTMDSNDPLAWYKNFSMSDLSNPPPNIINRLGVSYLSSDLLPAEYRLAENTPAIFSIAGKPFDGGIQKVKVISFITENTSLNWQEKTITFIPVTPSITASTPTPAVNTPMTFILNGIESIVDYIKEVVWKFGEDTVKAILNFTSAVQNIFQTVGEQVVTATVYDTNGNQLGNPASITVNVVDTSPVASLIGTPTALTVGQPVDIVIANSKAQAGYLCRYEISFTENSTVVSPPSDTTTPPVAPPIHVPASRIGGGCGGFGGDTPVTLSPYTVTFEYAGNFTITLTVTDNQGKTATVTQAIVVKPSTNIDWKLNPETGHLYTAVNCGTWTQCEAKAVELGGHLVSVNNAAEDNWLIKNYPMTTHYWIGATNDGVQSQWRWTSGEAFSYTNWGGNLNNLGGNENCAQYYSVTAGVWNDVQCNAPDIQSAIFEKSPDGTFVVNANDPIGTTFIVPAEATSCSFNATGNWRYGNASSQNVDALGDPSQAGMWPDYPRIYSEAPYFSLIAQTQGNYVYMGISKSLTVEGGQSMRFMINEGINSSVNAYADNSGFLTVSYSCNTTAMTTRFTKISNSGAPLADTAVSGNGANDWGCTKDNQSNLIWDIRTSDGGLRDGRWTYSWYDSVTGTGVQNGGICEGSSCDTSGYVSALNVANVCGYHFWRMPAKEELASLMYPYPRVRVDTVFFPNTYHSSDIQAYWSGSAYVGANYGAWMDSFYYGYYYGAYLDEKHYVMAVSK